MLLKHLSLYNFRNHGALNVGLCDKTCQIYGQNAQGKTAILEAVYFLSLGRSFRTSRLKDLIRHGSEKMSVEARFSLDGVDQTLKVMSTEQEKKVLHNATIYPSLSSLIGILPVVLIAPEDELVRGSPQVRRHFLDLQISQYDRAYIQHLSRYQKAMKQRNHLLKNRQLATIETWEGEMAASGAYLLRKRLQFIEQLEPYVQQTYDSLSGASHLIELFYQGKQLDPENPESSYRKQWESDREKEMQMKCTLNGPHRDDLQICLDGIDTRFFASQGQKTLLLASMRLATLELLKQQFRFYPLLLVDDFGAHLDDMRADNFFDRIKELGQVVFTSVKEMPAPYRYSLHEGVLSRC